MADATAPTQDTSYLSDAPVTDPEQDRFRRWPFAQRIAQTIAAHLDPSSLVVGLYGEWGEGKTTVLRFVERELRRHDHVICVQFNPWLYGDETQLLKHFFATLASALGASISTKRERIGEILQKYSGILSAISFSVSGLIEVSPGEGMKSLGDAMATTELDALKARLEEIIREAGKRVVVLMDDIDRLDKTEIQSTFRLVKLSADFAHTAYVLALDPQIVAAALQERYSDVTPHAGGGFLEKIVQVPLNLPPADPVALRSICFTAADQALQLAGITLTEEQAQAFAATFGEGFQPRLRTPRMAKRYSNAVTFALPILKGEANAVDVMLIEGLRVFYPNLYRFVRDNRSVFLGSTSALGGRDEEARQRRLALVQGALEQLPGSERVAAREVLTALFPRLKGVFGNTVYGSDWEERWLREQRVCSEEYGDRFFSYAIPEGDVPDAVIAGVEQRLSTDPPEAIADTLKTLVTVRNAERLILKLRLREETLTPPAVSTLIRAIARIGTALPNPAIFLSFNTPRAQAAILVSRLLKRLPRGSCRLTAARDVAEWAESLPFAVECVRWMQPGRDEKEEERFLSELEQREVQGIVVARIREIACKNLLYRAYPEEAAGLLGAWSAWGSRDETNAYLTRSFEDDPNNAVAFLRCYVPTAWSGESGLPHKSRIERNDYDQVARVVDPDTLYQALRRVYVQALDDPDYYGDHERPLDVRAAHQFADIHLKLSSSSPKTEPQADTDESQNAGKTSE